MLEEQKKRIERFSGPPTPHNEAKLGDIAPQVIMPGDPQRSQYVAKEFLTDTKLVNDVRGVKGYTGYYKDQKITTMAHGMGIPSIAIYTFELFSFYDVRSIIRIGSMGSFSPRLKCGDLVIVNGCCTNSSYLDNFDLNGAYACVPDGDLFELAIGVCKELKIPHKTGTVLSSDRFYNLNDDFRKWQHMGVLGVEMECVALYSNAALFNRRALGLDSVSDSLIDPSDNYSPKERATKFNDMIEVALETSLLASRLPDYPPYDAAEI